MMNAEKLGTITVFQAIEWELADADDPLLCWGAGECAYGGQHIAGELFLHGLPPERIHILRCCTCGKEFHPADDFELTLYRSRALSDAQGQTP